MTKRSSGADVGASRPGMFSLGKYQLFATLGRGGMADVFLAVARGPMGFNKLTVVKRLRPQLAEEETFRAMFLDEARLAARLNHPNVVHTYEVGEENGSFFIAMEYLEGQPLNKILREEQKRGTRMDPFMGAKIASDALAGLSHAHELKDYDGTPLEIIHRDISPHNIFVTYDGHVKVVDFGIAKAALSSTETEVGVLKGKVAYMAPEQAMNAVLDARADVFAMGIVLWEMITCDRLMGNESAANTLHRLMNVPIPRVSSVVTDVDPRLDAIVAKALEKEASARFASAAEMRDALEEFIATAKHPPKSSEVGAHVVAMFGRSRDEAHRQVQLHMAAVNPATSTEELAELTLDSLRKLQSSESAALLKLGGLISNAPPPPAGGSGTGHAMMNSVPPPDAAPARAPSGRGLLVALVVLLFFSFMTIAFLVFRPRHVGDENRANATTTREERRDLPSASPSVPAPPPAIASSAPIASTVPTIVTPDAAPIANTAPVSTHHHGNHATPAATTTPTSAAPSNEEPGFLTFDTYPWTRVSEAGKSLGTTPLVKVALPPGTHVLTVENPEQGITQSVTVTIKSGETMSRRLGLK